jgi:hypothetical protein
LTVVAPQNLRPDWAEQHSSSDGLALVDNNTPQHGYDLRNLQGTGLAGSTAQTREPQSRSLADNQGYASLNQLSQGADPTQYALQLAEELQSDDDGRVNIAPKKSPVKNSTPIKVNPPKPPVKPVAPKVPAKKALSLGMPGVPASVVVQGTGTLLALADLIAALDLSFRRDSTGLQLAAEFSSLSIDSSSDVDWFQFELGGNGVPGQFARIDLDHHAGNLVLDLYAGDGITHLDSSAKLDQDTQQLSLAGLARGIYFVRISGLPDATTGIGAANPNYALLFNVTPPIPAGGDWTEQNLHSDGPGKPLAYDLRNVIGTRMLSSLSVDSPTDLDYFRFTTVTTATTGNYVQINFNHAQGDLDLVLLAADGQTVLGQSSGTSNSEQIDLSQLHTGSSTYALPAGTYYVKVFGYQGAVNPQYTLTLDAPEPIGPDALQPNGTLAQATNLDSLAGLSLIPNLTITKGSADYFRFSVGSIVPGAQYSAGISFTSAAGALRLQLLNSSGTALSGRTTTLSNGTLQVSLTNLPEGIYYLKVDGLTVDVENRYCLNLNLPPAASSTSNTWTVMVYMTASTLADYVTPNLKQMEQAVGGLPSSVHFAVLLDWPTSIRYKVTTGAGSQSWNGTGQAIIQPGTNTYLVTTPFDLSLGNQNTGDPATLTQFIQWAAQTAPAEHYALVLWDHGKGVNGVNFDDLDGTTPDHLTIPELATALRTVTTQAQPIRIDLLAFDACLMQMAEVGFAVSPYVDMVVGSEEYECASGYDYSRAFATLRSNPGQVDARTVAGGLVQSYQNQYQGITSGEDTLSAATTSQYAAFTAALKIFTTAAASATNQDWMSLRAAQS